MRLLSCLVVLCLMIGCNEDNSSSAPTSGVIQLTSVSVGSQELSFSSSNTGVAIDQPIVFRFNAALDTNDIKGQFKLMDSDQVEIALNVFFLDENSTISLRTEADLRSNSNYTILVDELIGSMGEAFDGIALDFTTKTGTLTLTAISINGTEMATSETIQDVEVNFEIKAEFSHEVDPETITEQTVRLLGVGVPTVTRQFDVSGKTLTITASSDLRNFTRHRLIFSETISTSDGREFNGFDKLFYTELDQTFKFPEITDEELLTKVQEQTFKYFWDFAHPVSGLIRERNTSEENVTIGGSGFGVMSILVAIERGFVTREEGVARLVKIVDFLGGADRFHGVWPHWMNGTTGKTNPFSSDDDGGDLVETAFMIQGLLTVRQYLNEADPTEANLQSAITTLWEEVEWDWYTQGGQNVLYWHWSPNFGWQKNHKISGWNEALIVYALAAASPTHSISREVYDQGWSRNGSMQNGNSFYEVTLPLGNTRGGPLFFSHYSFLGLDPRNLEDQYANYWDQNVAHSQINRAYCMANPGDFVGYSGDCWGLTASDSHSGYSAHSPTNDLSVITPTAALSSIPYTPEESMAAMRHFYYLLGDKLWGEYGFYDAFSPTEAWYASSYLAIDQGPIICMIENHRTALLWDLFMSDSEIQLGLDKLGFTY